MSELISITPSPTRVRGAGGGRKRNAAVDPGALDRELLLKKPEVPEALKDDPVASAQWDLNAAVLVQRKILKKQHLPQLVMLCQQYSIYTAMMAQAMEKGFTVLGNEGNPKTNPTYLVALKAEQEYLKLCSLFMLDPTSEKRFQRAEEEGSKDNPFLSFR